MFKKLWKLLIIFLLLLILGCNIIPFEEGDGFVEFSVSMNSTNRTILYSLSENMIESLTIDFVDGPSVLHSKTFGYDEHIGFSLPSGNWKLGFSGLDEHNHVIVYAEATVSVIASNTVSADIELKPLISDDLSSNASGSVSIILNWNICTDSIKSEISDVKTSFNGQDVSSDLTKNLSSGTVEYSVDPYPSGNYVVEFEIFNTEGIMISCASEAVNVRNNLESSGSVYLNDEDFNLSGLSVNISIDLPEDETISFNYSNGHSFTLEDISNGVNVAIVDSNVYDGYSWSLYSYSLLSDSDSVALPADLTVGVYHLTVYVEKGGCLYSETLRFNIVG